MRYLFVVAVAAVFASCTPKAAQVQKPNYTVIEENGEKILNGYINRSIVENDTAFRWFRDNMQWAQTDANAIAAFSKNKDKFSMIVFGGTWCHDTQNLWPAFYKLIDKSGYPENKITLIGVKRDKTTIEDLHTKWHITNVPTFIVMHDGKEIGRVVEYGKYGQIDKELGEIVAAIK